MNSNEIHPLISQMLRGYRNENEKPWLISSKDDGRQIIYSSYCLLTNTDVGVLAAA